ncbi:hypothetical protein Y032_0021g455 [Ancylostoma ceylanicum]|uniref:Uncharacterized protein n=1 Tax=Ancylostoma ceylanicum TaxID=53326 RepID=A0A016V062_9BILA|nr:hypothetical protein Y032_0021g455 [Ancylostoma ceylanicum]
MLSTAYCDVLHQHNAGTLATTCPTLLEKTQPGGVGQLVAERKKMDEPARLARSSSLSLLSESFSIFARIMPITWRRARIYCKVLTLS